tara:strand:+ start:558 stop:932 length:375 start_codon:yes stop_codon:yes gene_type:complete
MAEQRAIDKLRKAFSVDARSSYAIKDGDNLVLKIYWTPLTIADRDEITKSMEALSIGDTENTLDFAIQMVIEKAEDSAGKKLFSPADRPSIRRELPMSIVLDIMTKMQGVSEEATPEDIKSEAG